METIQPTSLDHASERLAAEMVDVQASIELVASGVASRITLSGLHFGRAVAEHLRIAAAEAGVSVQTSWWPEDDVCDVEVARTHA